MTFTMAAWAVPPSSALMSTPNLANQSNYTLNLSSFLSPQDLPRSRIGLLRLGAEEAYTFSWRGKHAKYEAIPTIAQREGSSSKRKNGQKPPMQVTPAPLRKITANRAKRLVAKAEKAPHS